MYKKLFDSIRKKEAQNIIRISDGASIPFDPDNRDYQEYLEWTKASPMNIAEETE